MIPISGKNILANLVHINFENEYENYILTRFSIINNSNFKMPIKIFVKSSLNALERNYVFVSPKEEVLFLSNHYSLFLTSGIINHSTISQYGVLKRKITQKNKTWDSSV